MNRTRKISVRREIAILARLSQADMRGSQRKGRDCRQ